MQQISVRPKTRGMLLIEQRQGEPLETTLHRLYEVEGLTQQQIAGRLGIDTGTVSRWMTALGIEARYLGPRRPEVAA